MDNLWAGHEGSEMDFQLLLLRCECWAERVASEEEMAEDLIAGSSVAGRFFSGGSEDQ